MDVGSGNGNGKPSAEDPSSTAPSLNLPAAAPAPTPPIRDPKTGRILPGHSLNPKGKPPGIPNRNSELVKILNTTELRAAWKLAKKRAEKGDTSLMEFMLDRAFLKQTPEAAGIAINVNQANQQTNVHDERRFGLDELFADPGAREGALRVLESAAARGLFAGGARDVRQ